MMDQTGYPEEVLVEVLSEAVQKNVHLQFLIEEFVFSEKGEIRIPDDYKLYMFNGAIAGIQVINRFGPSEGHSSFYDEHWNALKCMNTYYPRAIPQHAPECLAQIIEYGKRLSQDYGIFARIDFYATSKGAVFGEFTPTPFLGRHFTPEAERVLVQYWDQYCPGKI